MKPIRKKYAGIPLDPQGVPPGGIPRREWADTDPFRWNGIDPERFFDRCGGSSPLYSHRFTPLLRR